MEEVHICRQQAGIVIQHFTTMKAWKKMYCDNGCAKYRFSFMYEEHCFV